MVIAIEGASEQVQVELIDLSGQVIARSLQNTNEQFQIGKVLSSGIYILKVIHANGVESSRLVKTN